MTTKTDKSWGCSMLASSPHFSSLFADLAEVSLKIATLSTAPRPPNRRLPTCLKYRTAPCLSVLVSGMRMNFYLKL